MQNVPRARAPKSADPKELKSHKQTISISKPNASAASNNKLDLEASIWWRRICSSPFFEIKKSEEKGKLNIKAAINGEVGKISK